jgi:uncharacterized protein
VSLHILSHNSPFSYTCNRCGECCRNRKILLNPYDTALLASLVDLPIQRFAERFIDKTDWSLRKDLKGCVFLNDSGCEVYAGRPTVCRLYPLAWRSNKHGDEQFLVLTPEATSKGEYGTASVVSDYVYGAVTKTQLLISEKYSRFFRRLAAALNDTIGGDSRHIRDLVLENRSLHERLFPRLQEYLPVNLLFEMQKVLSRYCKDHGINIPSSLEDRAELHVTALDSLLTLTGFDGFCSSLISHTDT